MKITDNKMVTPSKAQQVVNAVWPLVNGRNKKIFMALTVVALGMYFNWGWFVAAGIAPLVIGLLPCAAMCAFGLCMSHGGKSSCANKNQLPDSKGDVDE